jgi:hypothetical protein
MSDQRFVSGWEQQQTVNAHHRALILQILTKHPDGLTVQQIIEHELDMFGYTFLSDKRLREVKNRKLVECFGEKPQKWRRLKVVFV